MSEQKVWVDSELLKYDDLSLCCSKDFDNKFYTNNYSLVDNEEYFEATFKDIKDHDRELVRQVCEKIEDWCDKNFNWVSDGIGYDGQDYNEMIGSNNTINKLRGFLNQIQKEFE